MRIARAFGCFGLALLSSGAGCVSGAPAAVGTVGSEVISAPPAWAGEQGDHADTGCAVTLRQAYSTLEGRMGPQTDCSTGTCWAVVNVSFDVATSLVQADATPGVLWQSALDGQWRSTDAQPTWNAGLGYRRYAVALAHDTFTAGPNSQTVQLIPFVRTVAGGRGFDHNAIPDPLGSYSLSPDDNWQVTVNGTCLAAAPHGVRTEVYAQGWQDSGYGNWVQNGKLDINYDIYRIPSGLGCSHDGVPTFAVTAFAQFQPGGATLHERIDGPLGSDGKYQSLPLEFDIPGGATQVSLWFLDSSECNGDEWDSRYGANYVYSVSAN